jgi:crotonobetainyl-CoA:carnitine CoA-transferase CaiB-like acyl-CoA transferase
MSGDRPLQGLRVIDLADDKAELCGRLLADLGADVIRVEPPDGASSRRIPPLHAGVSLYFAYRNSNKRGITLDLESATDRGCLHELLAGADALIESFAPDHLARLGLAPVDLVEHHPHLVVTSISDFGQTGPYRDWVATCASMEAIAGQMWKAGSPQREPLIPPGAFAYDIASTTAAYATLLALWQRLRTGCGQHIDLSVLEAEAQATDWSYSGASVNRNQGASYPETRNGSGPVYGIYRCKGGSVRMIVLSARQWRALWEWLGSPEAFADPHWEQFLARLMNADVLTKLYEEHFAGMSMDEVCSEAQRRGIVCTPVLSPEQVLVNEHLVSRGTFVDAEIAPGVRGPIAAGYYEIDGVRQGFRRRAPEPGEHQREVLAERGARRPAAARRPAPSLPLEGLRVLDFGIGGVGVEAGRMLAEYGADVIKVESRSYPDFIRTVMGTEMSSSFASSSRSKRGFGVNLKTDEGRRVAGRLVERADVIIENSSTGTMDELGLGWEAVRRINPRCVMVSSQLLGSRGEWASWIGYGPSTQALGGLVHLWSYAGRAGPAGSQAIFPDHLVGRHVALLALAALLARERTGRGAHCEAAQIETVTGMLGDLLLKAALEPGSVRPMGNRSERGAPWGAYPCAGTDQWCVITVRDDADWASLRRALDDPAWAAAADLRRAEGRFARHDAIDAQLSEWTRALDKYEVTRRLQAVGVPAAPMLTATGMLDDPHYKARGFERPIDQQDLGRISMEGPAFRATGMSDVRIFQAPRLGEHTREICRELLGMDDAEIERLVAEGALEVPQTA